ncbi:MAG TPA: SDR family oxidoreductase [Sporolactobacillaceae bacterium]|nr:SDR family oxidoreductase [Sporolactobacillaceae bacterium]
MAFGLITGASGAIGNAIALQLANLGYSLYLHYNKNETAILELKKELNHLYPNQHFLVVQADLSEAKGIHTLLQGLSEQVELIIHNSGHSEVGLIQDLNEPELEAMIQHQVKSPFLLTQALIPSMIREKKGRIIFISSIWGLTGAAAEVAYSMVKGAQISFCKALAKELAPSGITVNAVAPGAIETAMLDVFTQEELKDLKEDIPVGRLGKPEEVASLVRYLCLPEAAYITGQVLSVNGGWYC